MRHETREELANKSWFHKLETEDFCKMLVASARHDGYNFDISFRINLEKDYITFWDIVPGSTEIIYFICYVDSYLNFLKKLIPYLLKATKHLFNNSDNKDSNWYDEKLKEYSKKEN